MLRIRVSALLAALALTAASAFAASARPNVLMIAIDDLNDWIGCLDGRPAALTPNIDGLAARGTLFYNAHCQAPICNPSRSSLLSGLRPSTTGIYGLQPGPRNVEMLKDWVMLPQYFQKNGYFTAAFGKIFHDGAVKPADRAKEFNVYGPAPPMPFPPKKLVENPWLKAMDWGVFPADDREQADWKTADNAIAQLRDAPKDKPFFIAAGFRLPHVPCFASQKWFDLYPEDKLQLPPVLSNDRKDVPDFAWYLHWKLPEPRLSWLEKNNQFAGLVRAYLASTSFMDSQVGRVLGALAADERAKNTVIVLWSDHGWHVGEKAITGKNTLWERSTRVPLIFAGPGVAQGVVREPAELLDVYPTLVSLCGLPVRGGLEGHSLMPQLRDASAKREWPAITTHNPDNHTVRTTKWRYIRYADGSEELYDMVGDANEWTNLAKDPRFASVKADLAKWLPAKSAPHAPGSAARILVRDGDIWRWEGQPVKWEELVD